MSVNLKQRERQVPTFYEDMPKLEQGPKKGLGVTNKFSSLMDEDDDENTSKTENKGIEEPAGTPAQWEAPTVLQAETPLHQPALVWEEISRSAIKPGDIVLTELHDWVGGVIYAVMVMIMIIN